MQLNKIISCKNNIIISEYEIILIFSYITKNEKFDYVFVFFIACRAKGRWIAGKRSENAYKETALFYVIEKLKKKTFNCCWGAAVLLVFHCVECRKRIRLPSKLKSTHIFSTLNRFKWTSTRLNKKSFFLLIGYANRTIGLRGIPKSPNFLEHILMLLRGPDAKRCKWPFCRVWAEHIKKSSDFKLTGTF